MCRGQLLSRSHNPRTPAVAAPAPTGLLCWAKPAGSVPWNALSPNDPTEVSWDGVWWWSRPDGVLQIQPLSRLAKNPELLSPYGVSSPLWVTNPTLLLADEPTGALDQATGEQVMALFRELNDEGRTIVMITHDLKIARHASRIVNILDGVLSEGVSAYD